MEGRSYSVLWLRSALLAAEVMEAHMGSPELLQQKGGLMRNGTTRFKVSAWVKTFPGHDGDDFNEALRDAVFYLRERESGILALKLLDPDLAVSIELILEFKGYHIGGVVDPDLLRYLVGSQVAFLLGFTSAILE